jgi:radical SAM family uncharacterized protein/radical SAM-linked protein
MAGLQDLLGQVEQPSRYLGTEINSVRKDLGRVKLRVALAFPDLYEIGTSHFGLQILYHILNQDPRIAAERVFAPGTDMDAALAARGQSLASLENRLPLGDFDIVGFSLLYELNYTNVLAMLERAQIPFYAAERQDGHPLVIAGGPCTCNPEPMAPFFDAMVVGDGEATLMQMAEAWLAWDRGDRKALLVQWAQIEGVYVPGHFEAVLDDRGFQRLRPVAGSGRVRRAVVADLDQAPFPDRPVVPFARPIHDRLRLEVARGCTRGCRFCQAGMIYRPVRERSAARLLETARRALRQTGYDELSLLSLSTGDYSRINALAETLMSDCAPQHVAVSLPSLRVGTLGPGLMQQIRRVRKTGFTIAVEAGSQRLREVINKNIREAEVLETVQDAFQLGWQTIKLYFMIGLPTESDEDVAAIADLVDRLGRMRPTRGRRGQINVSVATFIPKAHTPFQWAAQDDPRQARRKIEELRRRLTRPGIQFKWQDPRVSFLEGLWARGDRRLAFLLVAAYRSGCRFDGWSDQFRFDLWQEAIEASGIDPGFFCARTRDLDEPLPWDHVDIGVSKAYLQQEYRNALSGRSTGDCRQGDCQGCGVCDFEHLAPVVHLDQEVPAAQPGNQAREGGGFTVLMRYVKRGEARFFGHLETANLFQRALRCAGLPILFSEGFHPKPKIAFDDPLPVGIESLDACMTVVLSGPTDLEGVVERVNRRLPQGLQVIQVAAGGRVATPPESSYLVYPGSTPFDTARLALFRASGQWVWERTSAKGRVQRIDLKHAISRIDIDAHGRLAMTIRCTDGPAVRPADLLASVLGFDAAAIRSLRIVKTGSGAAAPPEKSPCFAN